MIEKVMEELMVKRAKERGFLSRKVSWPGRRGAPDRLFAKPGRLFFVELKQPTGSTSANQEREIREMREAGIEVHVIYNLREGYALFD